MRKLHNALRRGTAADRRTTRWVVDQLEVNHPELYEAAKADQAELAKKPDEETAEIEVVTGQAMSL